MIQGRIEDIESGMDVLEHIPSILIRGPLHNDPIAEATEWIRRLLWLGDFVRINAARDLANLVAQRIRNVAPTAEPV